MIVLFLLFIYLPSSVLHFNLFISSLVNFCSIAYIYISFICFVRYCTNSCSTLDSPLVTVALLYSILHILRFSMSRLKYPGPEPGTVKLVPLQRYISNHYVYACH